jgi:hypothetical protein
MTAISSCACDNSDNQNSKSWRLALIIDEHCLQVAHSASESVNFRTG